ncbi:MAG TPA: rhodanese-like domain-containing protein [Candidatus Binataceae bacterium]|nr:rhodanese-like domain-containing protein [Candidatus Binataceae bacterium]
MFVRDLGGVAAIFAISMLASAALNRVSGRPMALIYQSPEQRLSAELSRLVDTPPIYPSEVPTIELAEFRKQVENASALILDARSASFYEQAHVPGALNLARDEFAHDYQALKDRLDTFRDKPIVVYCTGGSCRDSRLVAAALISLGFSDVKVFAGGWDEWTQAGLPTETAKK